MDEPNSVELAGKIYTFDGRSWSCQDDQTEPPLVVVAQLNVTRAGLRERAEADAFARVIGRNERRRLRVLVTGARTWTDREAIRRELARLPGGSVIIHGGAVGADRLSGEAAVELGHEVIPCPAAWQRYGKAAGLLRNKAMLQEQQPDVVIAFHPALDKAKGTKHMVQIARAAGIPVCVIAE